MDAISWQLLIEGAWTTLWISAIAIAFGVVAGLLIALVRMLRLPVIDQLLVFGETYDNLPTEAITSPEQFHKLAGL